MRKVLVLVIGLLFFGANTYAAPGDLVVNGNLTVGGTISAPTISVPNVIIKYYESPSLTIVSGESRTLAHGLGTTPVLVQIWAKCITADNGYSVGDLVLVSPTYDAGYNVWFGASIVPDATNINVKYSTCSTVFGALNKTTGGFGALTNTKWNLIVRAWAM